VPLWVRASVGGGVCHDRHNGAGGADPPVSPEGRHLAGVRQQAFCLHRQQSHPLPPRLQTIAQVWLWMRPPDSHAGCIRAHLLYREKGGFSVICIIIRGFCSRFCRGAEHPLLHCRLRPRRGGCLHGRSEPWHLLAAVLCAGGGGGVAGAAAARAAGGVLLGRRACRASGGSLLQGRADSPLTASCRRWVLMLDGIFKRQFHGHDRL